MSKHSAEDPNHDLQDLAENWPHLDMDLVLFVQYATAEPDGCWSGEQIRQIAGHLFFEPPYSDRWNNESTLERIELMLMKGVDPDDSEATTFAERALGFRQSCECSGDLVVDKVVSADALLPVLMPLHTVKSSKKWKLCDVMSLAHALRGVATIDFGISTEEARTRWLDFSPRWEAYLAAHPTLKAIIDPVYVVVVLPDGVAAPTIWPALPASATFVLPEPLDGARHAWQFGNQVNAAFWAGQLRSIHPTLRVWMFSCSSPRILW